LRRISPVSITISYRRADWAILITVFPMSEDLPRPSAVRYGATLVRLTIRYVIQNVFHSLATWQGALSHFTDL
jgi:hypothetical protein